MSTENNKASQERDFHKGEGHSVPVLIKIAWTILFIWGISYFVLHILPELSLLTND